jgi:hypothetical protein
MHMRTGAAAPGSMIMRRVRLDFDRAGSRIDIELINSFDRGTVLLTVLVSIRHI